MEVYNVNFQEGLLIEIVTVVLCLIIIHIFNIRISDKSRNKLEYIVLGIGVLMMIINFEDKTFGLFLGLFLSVELIKRKL